MREVSIFLIIGTIHLATPGIPMSTLLDRAQLEAFWMPFTANRQFKKAPRLLTSASGMYFRTDDGREIEALHRFLRAREDMVPRAPRRRKSEARSDDCR